MTRLSGRRFLFLVNLRGGDQSKRADGEGAETFDLDGNGEELEAAVRKSVEAAKVLYDRNVVTEQNRVRRACGVGRGVDVVGVDANERGAVLGQIVRALFSEEWMIPAGVFFSAPVSIPTGVNQHRLVLDV